MEIQRTLEILSKGEHIMKSILATIITMSLLFCSSAFALEMDGQNHPLPNTPAMKLKQSSSSEQVTTEQAQRPEKRLDALASKEAPLDTVTIKGVTAPGGEIGHGKATPPGGEIGHGKAIPSGGEIGHGKAIPPGGEIGHGKKGDFIRVWLFGGEIGHSKQGNFISKWLLGGEIGHSKQIDLVAKIK